MHSDTHVCFRLALVSIDQLHNFHHSSVNLVLQIIATVIAICFEFLQVVFNFVSVFVCSVEFIRQKTHDQCDHISPNSSNCDKIISKINKSRIIRCDFNL